MRRKTLRMYGLLAHFSRHANKWLLRCLVFTFIFLSALISLRAEIYKWRDDTGVMRYSNKPPADPAQTPENLPTPTALPGTEPNGKAYYLNLPDEPTHKNAAAPALPPMTVPPDVLRQLKEDAPAPAISAAAQTPTDLAAVTIRLAELEKALVHETANRLKKEQEDAQTQAFIKQLQSQNNALKLALTQMEERLSALTEAAPGKTAQSGKLDAVAEYDVRVKLAALETEVAQLADALPAARGTDIAAKLAENGNMLKTVSEYQARQITDHQTQLETLRAEIEQLKARPPAAPEVKRIAQAGVADMLPLKAMPADVTALIAGIVEKNTFMEAVIKHQANVLKTQNEHLKEIEAKLAQLQSSAQPAKAQPAAAIGAEQLPQAETEALWNGITIVERKIRRESP